MKTTNAFLPFLAGCLLLLAACNVRQASSQADGKPVITVTIEPLRYFAEAIAGNRFAIVSMVPKGASAETYDPVPQQLVALGNSKVYFRIGHIGFEQAWMKRLADSAPGMQVFDTSEGIALIGDSTHRHATAAHAHAVEPHVWNSPANARIIAANVCRALCTLDGTHADSYRARLDSLCRRIDRTDSLIRQRLATPGAARAFLIYHPALSYFARDYGLTQVAIEEGGKEPSPAHLKSLIDRCRRERIRVIFVQPEFDRRNAEAIGQQTGARIVPINPLSYDWEAEMARVADALARP